ncbi:hypothetical protein H8959_016203 [Pygathrix nigripes]
MIHKNNLLLKIPIMGMILTLRRCTSNVSGAAERSWRRPTEAVFTYCTIAGILFYIYYTKDRQN